MPSSSLRPSTKINKGQTPARVKEKSTAEPDGKKNLVHRRSSSVIVPKTPVDKITTSKPVSLHTDDPSAAKGAVEKGAASISSRAGRMTTRSSIKSIQSQSSDSKSSPTSPIHPQETNSGSSPIQTTEEEAATTVLTASIVPKLSATFPRGKSNIPISRPASIMSLSVNPSLRAPTSAHRRSISLAVASPTSPAVEQTEDPAVISTNSPSKATPSSLRRSVSASQKSSSKSAIPPASDTTPNVRLSPSKIATTSKPSTTPSPVKASRPVTKTVVSKSSSSVRPPPTAGSPALPTAQKETVRPTPRTQSIPVLKKGHRPSLSTSIVSNSLIGSAGKKRPLSMALPGPSTSSAKKSIHAIQPAPSPVRMLKDAESLNFERMSIEEVDSEDSADETNIPSPIVRKVSVLGKTKKVMPKSPLKEVTGGSLDCSSPPGMAHPSSSLDSLNQSSSSQLLKDLLTPSITPYKSRVRPRPLVARNSLVHFEAIAQSFALEGEGDSLLHLPGEGLDSSFPDLGGLDLESPLGSLRKRSKKKSSIVPLAKVSEHAELASLQSKLDESLLAQAALNELLEREIGKVRELEESMAERQIEEDLLKASPVKASAPVMTRSFLGRPTTEMSALVEESELKLKNEVARLKAELESSTDCIEHLQTGLSELTEQLTSAQENVISTQDDLLSAKSKNAELEAENSLKTAELEAQQIAKTVERRNKANRAWEDVKMRAMGELEDLKGERAFLAVLEMTVRMLECEAKRTNGQVAPPHDS